MPNRTPGKFQKYMQKEGKFVNTNNRVEDEFENTDLITEMNIKVCSETMEPFSKMLLHGPAVR